MKLKKSEKYKLDKYQDCATEMKNKVEYTFVWIAMGTLKTLLKKLEKRLRYLVILGRIETVQTTALLRYIVW